MDWPSFRGTDYYYILPNSGDLPVAGQRALAILAFAVILWVTEAVSYPVSSAMIIALVTVMLGLAPQWKIATTDLGTSGALKMALSGFSNSAVALVAAALFLAAAMQITNLHKRLALWIFIASWYKNESDCLRRYFSIHSTSFLRTLCYSTCWRSCTNSTWHGCRIWLTT